MSARSQWALSRHEQSRAAPAPRPHSARSVGMTKARSEELALNTTQPPESSDLMPPLHTVLVPPLLCSERFYADLLPAAWAFGSVGVADTRRDDSVAGMARRLLESAPQRFVLGGTSMGGCVALEVMRQAPERVRGLVLISTTARPDDERQLIARGTQLEMVEQGHFDDLVKAAFPSLVTAEHEQDEDLLQQWSRTTHEVGAPVFLSQQKATMERPDSRPLLADISCPTVVIHGQGDRLIAPDNGQELAATIPGARMRWIDHAGHFALREQPDACADALTEFLTDLSAHTSSTRSNGGPR